MTQTAHVHEAPAPLTATDVTSRTIRTLPALEREMHDGLAAAWRELIDSDPLASCFQAAGWCLPWYRSYHDEFDPFVVLVESDGLLVGVVPLSVRRATGEILFASGTLADYRDIAARPGYRGAVVEQLLDVYASGRFPNPLQIGWVDPASDTPQLIADACRERGMRLTAWQQPCHRWFPAEGENLSKKFSRVRTHLNHFKRLGDVTFDVIRTPEEWQAFRGPFFDQHSLRQLQADRSVSFDDPRKQRFYDRLVDAGQLHTHVTALRVDGQLLSGHVGLVWRDVLMLGAPSISIEHEQRSPALILLGWVMQNAADLGLAGFDLTIGDTDFKRRLGNQTVHVTMIEVYGRRRSYYARAARTTVAGTVKRAVARIAGDETWKRRVKPALDRAARHISVAREEGVAQALRVASRGRRDEAVSPLVITPDSVTSAEPADGAAWLLRENRVEDLLLAADGSAITQRAVRECARTYAKQRAAGATFHALIRDGRLGAWCFSTRAADAGETTVTGLFARPDLGGDALGRLLTTRIARTAFEAGDARLIVQRG